MSASGRTDDIFPALENCVYTRCYCEENIWMLCDYVRRTNPSHLQYCYAVFISNHNKAIPIWKQRASSAPDRPVVWDYHVILVYQRDSEPSLVYDLDTILPFPCSFNQYITEAMGSDHFIKSDYHRFFRVIPAEMFLQMFASDRSHMIKEDHTWIAPPPMYPCIQIPGCPNNIQFFISMDPGIGCGQVHHLDDFINRFGISGHNDNLRSLLG